MVSGAMDLFTMDFGKLISTTMRGQFFGSKEVVYQAYVCAFFTAATEATKANPGWEIEVERYSGIAWLDLIVQRMRGSNATIEEHKPIDFSERNKTKGYSESRCRPLTNTAEKVLKQIETSRYRTAIKDYVTELREFSLALLGLYCAVVVRLLERDRGGNWKIQEVCGTDKDEPMRHDVLKCTRWFLAADAIY